MIDIRLYNAHYMYHHPIFELLGLGKMYINNMRNLQLVISYLDEWREEYEYIYLTVDPDRSVYVYSGAPTCRPLWWDTNRDTDKRPRASIYVGDFFNDELFGDFYDYDHAHTIAPIHITEFRSILANIIDCYEMIR